jgi:hypothetical protein
MLLQWCSTFFFNKKWRGETRFKGSKPPFLVEWCVVRQVVSMCE